jgi:hypothetical protein
LGWLDIEVVRVPSDWTDAQVKAFAIADNRTAELANWNQEVLTSQLLELEAEGWELAEFGFEAFELADEDKPIIEDEIPNSAPGRVALGDVWKLGNHVFVETRQMHQHIQRCILAKKNTPSLPTHHMASTMSKSLTSPASKMMVLSLLM